MSSRINRRQFLYGAGSLIALPALETFALTEGNTVPKRMICLGFGYGLTKETWFPDIADTGKDYKLTEGLEPLAKHKKDFTVIQGCSHKYSNEAHWGSTFWLTGANRYAVPGQSFSNSISMDQVAAQQLGTETRFTSMQFRSEDKDDGHGPGLSLAWNKQGKPLSGIDTPVAVFHRLFSASNTPLAQRKVELAKKRSVLDAVLRDAKSLKRKLSKSDEDKLDEYLQSVRDIEIQLGKDEKWMSVPKKKAPLEAPPSGLKGYDEISVMYDLMVAAFQTDSTRVITYRQPVNSLLQSLDISLTAHNISHYTPGERMEASKKRDAVQSKLLAGLLDKLKATKELDGTSLFDNVSLVYGSNIRNVHHIDNCPTLVSGGGSKLKLGQHIVEKKDTPLCNVWLTMLQGMGVNVESHGDSTGILKSLQA